MPRSNHSVADSPGSGGGRDHGLAARRDGARRLGAPRQLVDGEGELELTALRLPDAVAAARHHAAAGGDDAHAGQRPVGGQLAEQLAQRAADARRGHVGLAEPERGAQEDDVLKFEAEHPAVAPRPAPARMHHRPHARRRNGQHARDVGGAERRGAHGRSRRAHARACAGGWLTCSCARARCRWRPRPWRAPADARPRSRPPSPARRSSPPGSP